MKRPSHHYGEVSKRFHIVNRGEERAAKQRLKLGASYGGSGERGGGGRRRERKNRGVSKLDERGKRGKTWNSQRLLSRMSVRSTPICGPG